MQLRTADVRSLHRYDLFPDLLEYLTEYVGDGRARAVALEPLRRFLRLCMERAADGRVPTYEDYAEEPTVMYSISIALGFLEKNIAMGLTEKATKLLKYTGALFSLQAAAALIRVGREKFKTLFDDELGLRMLMTPVNRLARFLSDRRSSEEYQRAWESVHDFTFSVLFSLRCVYSIGGVVPDQTNFWLPLTSNTAWNCSAYLQLLYTAFWRPALPEISERWVLGGLFLTAEAMAGAEVAVVLQFQEIIALRRRGFKVSNPTELGATQLYAMRPLQHDWSALRYICSNVQCAKFTGTYTVR
ncbi:unnamed protein product [Peniophora sp. CBMAI 1063]|nr:unnamed protein product [Peniophora sp. CBMAI 1063]